MKEYEGNPAGVLHNYGIQNQTSSLFIIDIGGSAVDLTGMWHFQVIRLFEMPHDIEY